MKNCVFCKIVKDEIPIIKIGESKNFIAFLDIHPVNKGHSLVISKKHYKDFKHLPDKLGNELIKFSQEIVKKIGASNFNFTTNNGEKAGQDVLHLHFHIIPRFDNNEVPHWPRKKISKEELEKLSKKIIKR